MHWSHGLCFSIVLPCCPRKQYWISNARIGGFKITDITQNKLFPPLIFFNLSYHYSFETYWLKRFNPYRHVRHQPAWNHCHRICFIRLPFGASLHYAKHLFKRSAFVALVSTVPQHSSVTCNSGKEMAQEMQNSKTVVFLKRCRLDYWLHHRRLSPHVNHSVKNDHSIFSVPKLSTRASQYEAANTV